MAGCEYLIIQTPNPAYVRLIFSSQNEQRSSEKGAVGGKETYDPPVCTRPDQLSADHKAVIHDLIRKMNQQNFKKPGPFESRLEIKLLLEHVFKE